MESSRRELLDFKAKHPDGVPILPATYRLAPFAATASLPLDSPLPRSARSHGIPAAPFFVASVIEALSESKYAAITAVVPGEADTFCAAAARKACLGALIFTNDSDLLVHDIGPEGEVALLNQVEFVTDDGNTKPSRTCDIIRVSCFRNHDIAQRLGVDNCKRIAFEIKCHPSTTLEAAVQRAKRPPSDASAFTEFLSEFDPELPEPILPQQDHRLKWDRQMNHYLDPRVCELVLQLLDQTSIEPINIYLPPLIEDPARSSAWTSAIEERVFTYSCLRHHLPPKPSTRTRPINEVFRKGDRIASTQITLLNKPDTWKYARSLLHSLQVHDGNIRDRGIIASPYGFWRSYAVSRATTSTDAFQSAFRAEKASFWSWSDVQLAARIEAILYSLRVLRQLLGYLIAIRGASLPKAVSGLEQALASLPPLKVLMATRLEVLQRGE